MRKLAPVTYATADELFAKAANLETAADSLPQAERQAALKQVAKLRSYAELKQWVNKPANKP